MLYKCYWINSAGEKREEGIFETIKETKKYITIELRHYGYNCMYPQRKIRKLPKEFIRVKETSKCNGAQYWGSSIQVYHANDGIPFIYEPIKL